MTIPEDIAAVEAELKAQVEALRDLVEVKMKALSQRIDELADRMGLDRRITRLEEQSKKERPADGPHE